jgi:hypothetical protein
MSDQIDAPKMPVSEQLFYCTARILCLDTDGQQSIGTGHYFHFKISETLMPCLITNRHVVAGAVKAIFRLTATGPDGGPDHSKLVDITIEDFSYRHELHPDDGIDMAVIPLEPVFDLFRKAMNTEPFYIPLGPNLIPTAAELKELLAIESVTMVGYPNAIWDEKHNLPIARRGTTATPPWIDHNGKSEFMIDIAVVGGSSGSPVFLFDEGGWVNRDGGTQLGSSRIRLLGVLWGGPVYTAEGVIEDQPVPTDMRPVARTQMLINLGYCIKAERILEFVPALEERTKRRILEGLA